MTTAYPAALDVLTNPTASDTQASIDHPSQHATANDAIEALEAKLGITASTPVLGNLLVGTSTGGSTWQNTVDAATTFRVAGGSAGVIAAGYSADTAGARIYLDKSRHATLGSHTIVQSGDVLGRIYARGSNGTSFDNAAYIEFAVDGTPGATNDMPGRFSVYTTPDASATPVERMRITNAGLVGIGITPQSDSLLHVGGVIKVGSTNDTGRIALGEGLAAASNVGIWRGAANSVSGGNYLNLGGYDGIVFATGAAVVGSQTERMRIDNAGNVGIGAAPDSNQRLLIAHGNDNFQAVRAHATSGTYNNDIYLANADRAANSGYTFYSAYSGNIGDREFQVRGDGALFSDVAASTPADYAEYFETADGKPIPFGMTVVLEGDKVRAAKRSDKSSDILGVIRPPGTSSLVGNSHWSRWSGKYLEDEFGAKIIEDYEVWEWTEVVTEPDPTDPKKKVKREVLRSLAADSPLPEGWAKPPRDKKVTIQQRRKLNPEYDPEMEYVTREERPEWVIVGLLGQVPVLKGQPIGDRWIKMAERKTVDMWLIR